jgi:RHS repeat-associated protein
MARNFSWDPLEDNIVEEFDDDGNTVVEYTTEPDNHGNVISQIRDNMTSTFHFDGIGSTLVATNDSGAISDTFAYSAFGKVTHRTGTTVIPFQHVGRQGYYFDVITDNTHIRRRDYHPSSSRWLAKDVLPAMTSDYSYVGNRPLIMVDPSGLAGDDIKFVDHLVRKYNLSPDGRKALHEALKHLKGPGGLAPKAAVEEEAASIAALGGKFIKAGGAALLVLVVWLSLENTAQAAEIPTDWRKGSEPPETECTCECARFEAAVQVPAWWAADNAVWGRESQTSKWVAFGRLTAKECRDFEDEPRIIEEQSVIGYYIYNTARIRCRFGGSLGGRPMRIAQTGCCK